MKKSFFLLSSRGPSTDCYAYTEQTQQIPLGLENKPAGKETDLPEVLQGRADHRCLGHPVSKQKEAAIVENAHMSSPSLPTAHPYRKLCPQSSRAEREAGEV